MATVVTQERFRASDGSTFDTADDAAEREARLSITAALLVAGATRDALDAAGLMAKHRTALLASLSDVATAEAVFVQAVAAAAAAKAAGLPLPPAAAFGPVV